MPIRLFVLPSFHPAVGPQPAGDETVEGWEASPEPQQLPRASTL